VTGFGVDGPQFVFIKVNVTSSRFAREKRVSKNQTCDHIHATKRGITERD